MKKLLFVIVFIMVSHTIFSQSELIRFLSMGFNTLHQQRGTSSYYNYYFYGYEGYSEAIIFDYGVALSTEEMTFFPNARITNWYGSILYRRYNGQNNSIGYESLGPISGWQGQEHRYENDRLVYWALTDYRQVIATAERIQQNTENIMISFNTDKINIQYRYYNIPQNELLDIFLTKYVELIKTIYEMLNDNNYFYKNRLHEIISPVLEGRTARELAIFRNCLYAIKGYRFSTYSWTEFFNKYLTGYNARYSNAVVTAMFNNNERWLLDLIIQYENGR